MQKMIYSLFIFFMGLYPAAWSMPTISKWAVYYSDTEAIKNFSSYQLLVFDSNYHPPLIQLKNEEKIILAYISLGEIEQFRSYFKQAHKLKILGKENKIWKGSYYVDFRNHHWGKMVIEQLIPQMIHQGFDGIFIDTLDNAYEIEQQNPKINKGMVNAAVNLVKMIRENYPNIKIMINRGYDLLPELAPCINYALAESLYTSYNFNTKKYYIRPKSEYEIEITTLNKLRKINPSIMLFSLDYWNPKDKVQIKKIYSIERENGFIPYISTISLKELIQEPI